jgi:hypothetical protein
MGRTHFVMQDCSVRYVVAAFDPFYSTYITGPSQDPYKAVMQIQFSLEMEGPSRKCRLPDSNQH